MPRKMNKYLLVGLDIGTSKVVAVVGEVSEDGYIDVVGIGTHPSYGLKKGIVVNIDTTVQSVQRALEEAEVMAGCDIHSVYTGIAGSHINSFNSHGICAIRDGQVSKIDIDKVIDAAKAVAISDDKKILHILPQEFCVDNQKGILDPLGMTGVRLECDIHMVIGSVNAAQNIVNCIRKTNVEVEDIILQPLASSYAVLTDDERKVGVCLVDIGGGTTDVSIYYNGTIKHTAVLPVAGDQVTNDLSIAFKLSSVNAEKLKIKHGSALFSMSNDKSPLDLSDIVEKVDFPISKADIAEVLEPRFEELMLLVKKEIAKAGYTDKIATIVLTGGSSNINGIKELAKKVFKVPARIGLPQNITGIKDVINNPSYATAVGLLIYGNLSQKHKRLEFSAKRGIKEAFGRVKNWLQGNF